VDALSGFSLFSLLMHYRCTAILIISEKGLWFTHLAEPGFLGGGVEYEKRWVSSQCALPPKGSSEGNRDAVPAFTDPLKRP